MTERPYVLNAADKEQVRHAQRKTKTREEQARADWKVALSTEAGRRVFWKILEECGVLRSIWKPSAEIHYLAGKQDVGHWLMAEIARADDEALARMMMEAQQGERKENRETEAMQMTRKDEADTFGNE